MNAFPMLPDLQNLKDQLWYHVECTRESAEQLLGQCPAGAFIVRPSRRADCLALSHKLEEETGHALIYITDKGYKLERFPETYGTLRALLESRKLNFVESENLKRRMLGMNVPSNNIPRPAPSGVIRQPSIPAPLARPSSMFGMSSMNATLPSNALKSSDSQGSIPGSIQLPFRNAGSLNIQNLDMSQLQQRCRELLENQTFLLRTCQEDRDHFNKQVKNLEDELLRTQQENGATKDSKKPKGVAAVFKSYSKEKEKEGVTIAFQQIQVNEKLAETGGSSASVFAACIDGWNCAMKELDLSDIDDYAKEAFEKEIELIEKLPFNINICRYLHHERKSNKIRLFMTRYACSLGGKIKDMKKANAATPGSKQCFSPENIIHYMILIARGLEFLHDKNIVHRDLKSDNIFVTYDERKEIKELAIGDFDTAKRVSEKTMAKTVIGTPGYMAPEILQANKEGEYNSKADIWSYAMVLYELMTLQRPYENEHPFQVPAMIIQGIKPAFPPDLGESYSGLKNFFDRCTQMNPADRPLSSELKQMLIQLKF